jgi:rSAM/selenodomain-associated transferase 1
VPAATAADNSRALIIFAKHPLPGKVKTRLSPPLSPEDAARLYACMLQDTLDTARSLDGITPFIFFQDDPGAAAFFAATAPEIAAVPQQGADLGERMKRAFNEVVARGFGELVIIGSDSPDLPAGFIVEAFTLLAHGDIDVVFGPSADGGYYLLGMKRVRDELFTGIPWSSGSVLEKSLCKAKEANLGVALLPQWYDLDEPADLERTELRAEGSPAVRTGKFLRQKLSLPVSNQG